MVTGIETAGLILAVLPLVISALENYKDGLQAIKRLYYSEAQLRKLIRTLKVQRSKYRSNLEKLVKAAAPDLGIQDLPDDYSDQIWHGELNSRAKAYLGTRYEAFRLVVEDFEGCIREIARKLRHTNRPRSADKTDLQALMAENPSKDGNFTWLKKIDFTMKEKDLRRLTDELDNSNLTLGSFINDSDMLDRLAANSSETLRAQTLSDALQRIRLQADFLHAALRNARLPDCDISHRVMLHLEDRLPSKRDVRFGRMEPVEQTVNFSLSIEWQPLDPSCGSCWHQTAVTVPKVPSNHQKQVDDICQLIDEAQKLNHAINFHLLDQELVQIQNPQGKAQPAVREMDTVTLQQLFDEQRKFQPKESTTLALKLASSLLQLNFTSWLETKLTKSKISFFRLTNQSVVHTNRPLLEQIFNKRVSTTQSMPATISPTVTLFEFGILLMELYTQVSFETWMIKSGNLCKDDSYYARLPVAMMWFDQEESTFPLEYRKVISCCLLRSSFEGYSASWDDQIFRETVCLKVIEPLQQTCAIW